MNLDELKKVWQTDSEKLLNERQIDAEKFDQLLQKRGSGILSRLDRNVQIGFWLLGLFIFFALADQFLPFEQLFPSYIKTEIVTPSWLSFLSWLVNSIVILSFILFFFRYKNLKIKTLASQDMPAALRSVLRLLDTFKKEFYLAMMVFISANATGFLFGVWQGFSLATAKASIGLKTEFLIGIVVILLLAIFAGVLFYIFQKGFNALYGKYRDQLTAALHELEETED